MKPGTVVIQRYTIEALAGSGGMGAVYRARDLDGTAVALKVLGRGNAERDSRFTREARMMIALRHPAIVHCSHSGITEAGERFLAMEWLDGQDLRVRLRSGPLALRDALTVALRMADALGVAHERGMVHRDVKPRNIFLPAGDVNEAKLLDFGVARWSTDASLTATGMQIGTPSYMPPEQIQSEDRIEPAADVFALGCVLYECLTGEMAFPGEHPMAVFYKILSEGTPAISDVVRGVPTSVASLVERMLAKDPKQRPGDGAAVAREIEHIRKELTRAGAVHVITPAVPDGQAITTSERNLLSAILLRANRASAGEPDEGREEPGSGRVTHILTESRSAAEIDALTRMRTRYESFGVRFESLGDGSLLAVLDSRRSATDQAVDAVRCALELRQVFTREPMAVVMGRAAPGKHRLLGDIIDRATEMLYAAAEPVRDQVHPIRVDPITAGLLGSRFHVIERESGPHLLWDHASAHDRLLGKPTPLVGRKREMATMLATFEECMEECVARVVLLNAKPGAGKSRLLRAVLHELEETSEPVIVWRAQADPMRMGSPLDLVAQALRETAEVHDGEPLDRKQEKLRARVARSVAEPERARVTAYLGELIDVQWPAAYEPSLEGARRSPRVMADQIRRACLDLLRADARQGVVIVALDDMHWGDRATVELFDRALREFANAPVLLIGAGRPEMMDRFPDLFATHDNVELILRPLSKRAAAQLIRAVLGAELPRSRLELLIERASGHVLYLEELLRAADAGQWEVPETVLAMMQSRLEDLPPKARRALRAASVFGERFWRGGLEEILGGAPRLQRELRVLVERELIAPVIESRFSEQAEYRFHHDLVRQAAYSMLTSDDARVGHRLAAEWLERIGELDPLVLAEHFERGQRPERAVKYLVRAAHQASKAGDFSAVLMLAERACASEGSEPFLGELHAMQAAAHFWRDEPDHAAVHGEQALAMLPYGSRSWYEVAETTLYAQTRLGRIDLLVARAAELAVTGRPGDHDLEGWLMLAAFLAKYLFLYGELDAGRWLGTRVEAEMQAVTADLESRDLDTALPAVAGRVHTWRGIEAAVIERDPAKALTRIKRAVACFRKAGDACRTCLEEISTSFAELELGLYEHAIDTLRPALATAENLGVAYLSDSARQNLAIALARMDHRSGNLAEAEDLARMSTESYERRGNWRMATGSRIYLVHIHMATGDLERAETEAHAAVDSAPETSPVLACAWAVLARVLVARHAADKGSADRAMNFATSAMELMTALGGLDEGESLVRLAYAEALYAIGDARAAAAAIGDARHHLHERAARIAHPEWRASFLERVPEHVRTIELYERWTRAPT